jgi:hypothetical protein
MVERAQSDAQLAQALCRRLPHRAEVLGLFLHAARTDRLLMIASVRSRMGQSETQATALDANVSANLETAAQTSLEAFAICLAQNLHLSEELAHSIVQDQGGEPLIIALRALGLDADTIASLSRDDLSEGQMAWRRALCAAVLQPLAQMILQASTSTALTTYAEQKPQISLSA